MGTRSLADVANSNSPAGYSFCRAKTFWLIGDRPRLISPSPIAFSRYLASCFCRLLTSSNLWNIPDSRPSFSSTRTADFSFNCRRLGKIRAYRYFGSNSFICTFLHPLKNPSVSGFYPEAANQMGADRTRCLIFRFRLFNRRYQQINTDEPTYNFIWVHPRRSAVKKIYIKT